MSEEKTYVEDVNRTIYDVIDDDKDSVSTELVFFKNFPQISF